MAAAVGRPAIPDKQLDGVLRAVRHGQPREGEHGFEAVEQALLLHGQVP